MLYFDSSVLVCLLSSEVRTEAVQAWFSELDPDALLMSDWNITEFYSALSFKRRTRQLSPEQRSQAEKLFEIYRETYFKLVPISSTHFHRAALIAGREDINIRAADALHLAIAEVGKATLCTLDRKMNDAADAMGVDCFIP